MYSFALFFNKLVPVAFGIVFSVKDTCYSALELDKTKPLISTGLSNGSESIIP